MSHVAFVAVVLSYFRLSRSIIRSRGSQHWARMAFWRGTGISLNLIVDSGLTPFPALQNPVVGKPYSQSLSASGEALSRALELKRDPRRLHILKPSANGSNLLIPWTLCAMYKLGPLPTALESRKIWNFAAERPPGLSVLSKLEKLPKIHNFANISIDGSYSQPLCSRSR